MSSVSSGRSSALLTRLVAFLLVSVSLSAGSAQVLAQGHAGAVPAVPGEYERKTIVFLPGLLELARTGLAQAERNLILEGIGARVSDMRFQRLSFTKEAATAFVGKASNTNKAGTEVEPVVRELLLPELTKILAVQRLILAQSYQSESDRQRFIVQKAKELGIDAGHLEKAMEFSFIAVPVLKSWRKGDGKTIPRLEAGIYWYGVEVTGSSLTVAFAGETIAASGGRTPFHSDNYEKHPFTTAFKSFCENLTIELRSRDGFRYSSQIIDAEGGVLRLSIGRADGVKVDDLYRLYGFTQKNLLTPAIRVDHGFVRISKLRGEGEGNLVRSEARAVTARDAALGMMLEEIPCSSYEGEISITAIPYDVTAGALFDAERSYMEVADSSRRWAFALAVGVQKSLAGAGLAQTYCGGRFMFGGTYTSATFMGGRYDESRTMVLGGGIGVEKRAYAGAVGLNVGVGFGALLFDSHFANDAGTENESWKFYTFRYGPTASIGLSLWVNPLLQVHAVGERRWFGDSTNWQVERSGSAVAVFSDGLDIHMDAFAIRVYLSRRFGRSPL